MPRGLQMAVNRGPLLRKPARRTRVIEVDVRDEDLPQRFGGHAEALQRRTQRGQGGAGPGLDQRVLAPAFQQVGGDQAGRGAEMEVDGGDAHGKNRPGRPGRTFTGQRGGHELKGW